MDLKFSWIIHPVFHLHSVKKSFSMNHWKWKMLNVPHQSWPMSFFFSFPKSKTVNRIVLTADRFPTDSLFGYAILMEKICRWRSATWENVLARDSYNSAWTRHNTNISLSKSSSSIMSFLINFILGRFISNRNKKILGIFSSLFLILVSRHYPIQYQSMSIGKTFIFYYFQYMVDVRDIINHFHAFYSYQRQSCSIIINRGCNVLLIKRSINFILLLLGDIHDDQIMTKGATVNSTSCGTFWKVDWFARGWIDRGCIKIIF